MIFIILLSPNFRCKTNVTKTWLFSSKKEYQEFPAIPVALAIRGALEVRFRLLNILKNRMVQFVYVLEYFQKRYWLTDFVLLTKFSLTGWFVWSKRLLKQKVNNRLKGLSVCSLRITNCRALAKIKAIAVIWYIFTFSQLWFQYIFSVRILNI